MSSAKEAERELDFAEIDARIRKRQRRIVGLIALSVIAGAGAIVAFSRWVERQAASQAAGQLRNCLLGGPLDSNESAARRFRRRQLGVLALSDVERGTRDMKLWPLSCRDQADLALQRLHGVASDEQAKRMAELVKELSNPTAVSKDLSTPVEVVTALLDERFPAPVTRGSDAIPPLVPGADDLPAASMLSNHGTSLGRSYTEDNPGPTLPVLVDEEGLPAPLFCTFRAENKQAQCRALGELSSVHGHGLRLLATADADAQHLVFAGRRGSEGIFLTGSPAPIDKVYSYGGYAASDGSVSLLGWDESARSLVLVQAAKGQPPQRTPLKPNFRVGNFFYGSQILWDQVLVRGVTPKNERRLFQLPLGAGEEKSFGLVDIGELPEAGLIRPGEEDQPHLTGCRTRDATVVRVRGTDSDSLTFRLKSSFTAPVRAPAFGLLGCYGTTATIVNVVHGNSGALRIYHDACTSAGCTHSVVKGQSLDHESSELRLQDSKDIAAVDLGGKLLVVWLAGTRGGLRIRLAQPDLFDRTEDVVLLDDHVLGGKNADLSTVLGFRLYSREGFAVLLVSTIAGLHAYRIDPAGSVQTFDVNHVG